MSKKTSSSNLKAFLFDLGKVIVWFDFDPSYRYLSKKTILSPEEIKSAFFRSGLEVLYDGGKISSRRFYMEVKKILKHRLNYKQFQKIWNEIFTPNKPMIELIRFLKGRYRLILISNTNQMHYEYIQKKFPFMNLFNRVILSYKEKLRKPDEDFYKKAIRACRAKPEEIFYIDDREDFTDAAKALGIKTFTYKKNHAALLTHLKKLKVPLKR